MMLLLQPQTRLPLSVQQQRRVPLTRRAALASYSRYSCIHEQPRAAAPVPACFLRSTRQARVRTISCCWSLGHSRSPQAEATLLGTYAIGVARHVSCYLCLPATTSSRADLTTRSKTHACHAMQARQLLHICSACADPGEGSQDGLIALQDPQGSHTAAYVVGVRPGAPGDGLSQVCLTSCLNS